MNGIAREPWASLRLPTAILDRPFRPGDLDWAFRSRDWTGLSGRHVFSVFFGNPSSEESSVGACPRGDACRVASARRSDPRRPQGATLQLAGQWTEKGDGGGLDAAADRQDSAELAIDLERDAVGGIDAQFAELAVDHAAAADVAAKKYA